LSAIAARTQQVKLGTICLASFPLRDPLLLAIQWASLDVLSHGRTILAVCNGGSAQDGPQFAHELAVMRISSQERVGCLIEGLTLLRRVWSEELVERVSAAVTDRILRRVATYGDGWQTDATPVDTFRQRFETIRTYAARQGRDPSQLESCLHLMVNINDGRHQAFQEATTFLASYYGTGAVSHERAELWLAYGSPAAVIEKIQAYIDAGCTMPVLRFVAPNLTEQLQRGIEEVLPAFRADC
jgi:alkanesulfonate monooxygenase SsuD/methylene tetrahydromethanopterin reductase-like flavin-dependent oxidoreductase (luciferase family)